MRDRLKRLSEIKKKKEKGKIEEKKQIKRNKQREKKKKKENKTTQGHVLPRRKHFWQPQSVILLSYL